MTLIAVSIAVSSAGELDLAIERARGAAANGARMVEWRIDRLAAEPEAAAATKGLVRDSPLPSIVTCRRDDEGGWWAGDETQRAALYEAVVRGDHPPRYIDIELDAYSANPALRRRVDEALEEGGRRDVHASLILSLHDLEGRPRDLLQRIEAMTAEPRCAVIKAAWRARSIRDNLECFDLLAAPTKPTIALCLGPFGLMSRVLAPKFGALLVYAADAGGGETAPGQPTVADLAGRYRFESIGPDTAVYGVIGWPVEQSAGPAVHNAGFAAVAHDGVYLPLPVPTEYEHFKATVGVLVDHPGLSFAGASVTSPHKEHLLAFVEERGGRVEDLARRIGAANTLASGDGPPECLNTDAPAALDTLCAGMGIEPSGLAGTRVAVLGAGGVARAVVAALAEAGAAVVIFNRTRWRAEALAEAFGGRPTASGLPARVAVGKPQSISCGCFDVFVNCTPLGMAGEQEDGSPLPPGVPLDGGVTVFETIYNPPRTPLLERAEAQGARTIPGTGMFLRQAALQFERWTGRPAPMAVFENGRRI